MAAAYLQEEKIPLRSFPEVLRGMYPAPDILSRLVDYFLLTESGANAQSLGKKLRNWLSGRNLPVNRRDYFRIAFALSLSEQQLDYLLGLFTDYGIQYRSGWEVIFTWFLRHGYGYLEAKEFFDSLPPATDVELSLIHISISAGVSPPMSRPMGRWIVSICARENPRRSSSSHRKAFFFRLPMQPT